MSSSNNDSTRNENPGMVTSDSIAATSDPAPDAEARKASEEWSESAALNTGLGQSKEGEVSAGGGGGSGGVTDQSAGSSGGGDNIDKPKGEGLTEGGFDADAPNASYTTDIGGKDDPGRVALGRFEEQNVPVAGGAGPREDKVSNDGQFDVLEDASA